MRSFKAEFDRRGITIAVVSFAEPANLIHYQQQHRWPFTLLADPKRKAYATFTLNRLSWLQVFSVTTIKLYCKLLRAGMRRENYGKDDIYQAGGDFLLDRAGNILFAQRSQDPADRPSAEKLLQEFDRLVTSTKV
jgi:peroxiredoxin